MGRKPTVPVKPCINEGCKNEARTGRNQCRPCEHIRLKEKDPVKFAFQSLRRSARRRNKEFTISLEQFTEFCVKTDYIRKKGRKGESYHIDRIDETKGYTIDNIQVLTNSENVKKYLDYRWGGNRMEFVHKVIVENPISDVPF